MRQPHQTSTRTGAYRRIDGGEEPVWAFIPKLLPPEPPIERDGGLEVKLGKAMHALGGLNAVGSFLPDPNLFLYMYVRKEAVLSSQIEGTQSSLSDLLLHEIEGVPGVPIDDVEEASAYVRALQHGFDALRDPVGLPLCLRLLREIHGVLLATTRGATRQPGEFRRSQNWIGGSRPGNARFVPPPSDELPAALGNLEQFVHGPTPVLVKAAVAHVQFETIHPFLDGNGRIGRMLITLILHEDGVLGLPLLYLSLFLKEHRDTYYDLLMRVRNEGAWEEWIDFFLDGVVETATAATATTRSILDLVSRDRTRIAGQGGGAMTVVRLHEHLIRNALLHDAYAVAGGLGVTPPTLYKAIDVLEGLGVLREITGQRRGRIWVYDDYLALLNAGTERPA